MAPRILAIAAAIALISSAASAQELVQAPAKSKKVALGLSVAATLAPLAAGSMILASSSEKGDLAGLGLMSLGLALGPSVGRVYADGSFSGTRISGRLMGVGLVALGVAGVTHSRQELLAEHTSDWKEWGSAAVAGLGATIIAVSALKDAADARHAVDEFNRQKPKVEWSIGPKYFARDHAVGASVTFKF